MTSKADLLNGPRDLREPKNPRLEQILDLILQLSSGNLQARLPVTECKDEINNVIVGLNMLAEELEYSIKEKEQAIIVEKKRAKELDALNQQLKASEQQMKAANQQLYAANQQLAAKEQALQAAKEQLTDKMTTLERFNKIMVGRELVMINLKEEVNSLLQRLGEPPKYETPGQ